MANVPNTARPVTSSTSYATVVYFHFKNQIFNPINLKTVTERSLDVDLGIIEGEITSVDTDKNLTRAAGTFDIEVLPSKNWKRLLAPGDWVLIYLFRKKTDRVNLRNLSTNNLAILGNIDRVSRTETRDEKSDKKTVRYRISGRDFGKIFEETDLFFNPYIAQSSNSDLIDVILKTKGIPYSGSPTTLVNKMLDVFIGENGATFEIGSLKGERTPSTNQWRIPIELSRVFGSRGTFFNQILSRDIKNLAGFKKVAMMVPYSNGSLWGQLKSNSNEIVNELFCELSGGKPSIFLRSRPNSQLFDKISLAAPAVSTLKNG